MPEGIPRLRISRSNKCFDRNGRPFFYFADTAWSAFTHASESEWMEYLRVRRSQGFNAVQINILPQHDASVREIRQPFARDGDGGYRIDAPNEEYFAHAERLLSMAVETGMVPALVLLWANYVPGNWLSKERPNDALRFEAVAPYTAAAAERFKPYGPVYLISGDTDLEDEETMRYYRAALGALRKSDPEALATLHLRGTYTRIPETLGTDLDFIMYQSGHGDADTEKGYEMAEALSGWEKPLLNGEPNYEGFLTFGGSRRISRFDVRKVSWQSVLAGANAGITYGAHGIWPWVAPGDELSPFYQLHQPFYWTDCLNFPAPRDLAFLKEVWEDYRIYELSPAQQQLESSRPYIRAAASKEGDRILIYTPIAVDIPLSFDCSAYTIRMTALCDRHPVTPEVKNRDGKSCIKIAAVNSDYLLILEKG